MIKDTGYFSVEYDDSPVWFKNSPIIVKFTRKTAAVQYLSLTVSDLGSVESITSLLYLDGIGNYISVDVSRFLRAFGPNIEISVRGSSPAMHGTVTITKYCIDGARGAIQYFGGEYNIRRWDGYPLTIAILYNRNAEVYREDGVSKSLWKELTASNIENGSGIILENLEVPAARYAQKIYSDAEVFNGFGWEENRWQYNIKEDCEPGNPLYLRWKDTTGLTWYWMFSIKEITYSTEEALSYGKIPVTTGVNIDEWDSAMSKSVKRVAKIVANNVTAEEYNVLRTLATSAVVDAYDNDLDVWYRLRIPVGDFPDVKGNYKEVEFSIEFPPQKTQIK